MKYGLYAMAIAPFIESFKADIAKSEDGTIRMKTSDMAKKLGMVGKNDKSVSTGVKYVLFHEGIVVNTGTEDGKNILIMRERVEQDWLPPYLTDKSPVDE